MTSTPAKYDAVVIGGGPAGATAARLLAAGGASVALLEKHHHPRTKICAGGLPPHLFEITGPLPPELIECEALKTTFSLCFKKHVSAETVSPGIFMVMRRDFDHWLITGSRRAGATIIEGDELVGLEETTTAVTLTTASGRRYHAGWVIGADGALSRTAKAVGLLPQRFLGVAVNAEVAVTAEARAQQGNAAAMDINSVPHGYGWIFPKKTHLSCGIGSADAKMPGARAILNNFLAKMPTTRNRLATEVRGFPLPYCIGTEPIVTNRVLLAGDAASLVDPLSGEGIYYAARSGQMAAQALLRGATATAYQEQVNDEIRDDLHYAKKLSDIFFQFPTIAYSLGVKNRRVVSYFEELLLGRRTYRSIFHDLKNEFSAPFQTLVRAIPFVP